MRELVFDTETTGKRYQDGHRVVEIGAIEIIDGKLTGNDLRILINPQRSIPDEVVAVHGITDDMVKDCPTFKEIIPEFVEYFKGARVIAHNSSFDEKFLDHELKLAGYKESFWSIVESTVDTIAMSRRIWLGGQYRHSLDHVLDRCEINRDERVLHGALLDSQLLAKAYLKMKKMIIDLGPTVEDDVERKPIKRMMLRNPLPAVEISDEDIKLNDSIISSIRSNSASSFKP